MTDDLRSDALAHLALGLGIDREGEIRMGLDVDEAGRNREPRRIDDPGRIARQIGCHRRDAAARDGDIAKRTGAAAAVEHQAAAYQDIAGHVESAVPRKSAIVTNSRWPRRVQRPQAPAYRHAASAGRMREFRRASCNRIGFIRYDPSRT